MEDAAGRMPRWNEPSSAGRHTGCHGAAVSVRSAQAGLLFAEEKWTLRILNAVLWKPMGFNQLCRFLVGISPNTLARRLDRLETMGLVDRRVLSTTPPATRYSATAVLRELRPILDGLASWGAAHARTAPEEDRTA